MAFCSSCGTEIPERSAFCGACGASTSGPAPTPPPGLEPRRRPVLRLFPFSLRVAGVIAAVAALLGIGVGLATADREAGTFKSGDQAAVLTSRGEPPVWVLADGPVEPGGASHRVETWYYPETGDGIRFVDGGNAGETAARLATVPGAEVVVSPRDLHRKMSRKQVEGRMQEEGAFVSMDSDYAGSEAFAYRKSGLLVTYLEGKFFTAQAYFPGAGN